MCLLLLDIGGERPAGRGNGLWEIALGTCPDSGLKSPGLGRWGGRDPSLSQRQEKRGTAKTTPGLQCAVQACMQLKQVCRTVVLWLSTVTPGCSLETLSSCAIPETFLPYDDRSTKVCQAQVFNHSVYMILTKQSVGHIQHWSGSRAGSGTGP